MLSHVQLFVTPWTVARQAPLSIEFSRQEYWSGLPFPSAGGLPDTGIEPRSPALQADSLPGNEPPVKVNFYLIAFRSFSTLAKGSRDQSRWKKSEVKVLVAQSRPTLCDPMDYSLPVSSVHGILQPRILEWVATPISRGSSPLRD